MHSVNIQYSLTCGFCYRSATPSSSAAGRATYCWAPFLAHVCPTSHGVDSRLSALVRTHSPHPKKNKYGWVKKAIMNKKSEACISHVLFTAPLSLHLALCFALAAPILCVSPLILGHPHFVMSSIHAATSPWTKWEQQSTIKITCQSLLTMHKSCHFIDSSNHSC